jgi:hypothetical protein
MRQIILNDIAGPHVPFAHTAERGAMILPRAVDLVLRLRQLQQIGGTCEPLHILFARSVVPLNSWRVFGATEMTCFHGDFDIASFEAGRGLWHARSRCANRQPLTINRAALSRMDVGFAWPDRTAAIADAKIHTDRFGPHLASHDASSGMQLATLA